MAPFRLPRCSGSRACTAGQQVPHSGTNPLQPCLSDAPSPCSPPRVDVAPVTQASCTSPAALAAPVAAVTASAGQEPAPGTPAALALLAAAGVGLRAAAGRATGADHQRFSPVTISHLTHRLVEVKQLLDQLTAEQKELHETLRLAHLRGDLLHLVPPGQEPGTYQLPEGPTLHRRQGRKQWHYSEVTAELEAQLKARQVYEQAAGLATTSIGASFWELRFPKS